MRHLHCVQSLEPLQGGGLGVAALAMHQALLDDGLPSQLISTRAAAFPATWEGVTQYRRLPPGKAFWAPELFTQRALWLSKADCVHAHGFYVGTNAALCRGARQRNLALVYHPHGFFDPWILKRSRSIKWLSMQLFEGANMQAVTFWRALTSKEADQIREQGFTQPIEVIPNGVHIPESTQRANWRSLHPCPRKRLVFLGRIHPKKGLDMLLNAWHQLHTQYADWQLDLYGPDEGGYAATITAMIQALQLSGSCHWHGPVSGDAKCQAFATADAFVLPSYSEGFPMAVLEGASWQLPVVMTTECNFPELEAAGGALLCEPETGSLQAALAACLSAPDSQRTSMGTSAHAFVAAHYSWKVLARHLDAACHNHAP